MSENDIKLSALTKYARNYRRIMAKEYGLAVSYDDSLKTRGQVTLEQDLMDKLKEQQRHALDVEASHTVHVAFGVKQDDCPQCQSESSVNWLDTCSECGQYTGPDTPPDKKDEEDEERNLPELSDEDAARALCAVGLAGKAQDVVAKLKEQGIVLAKHDVG